MTRGFYIRTPEMNKRMSQALKGRTITWGNKISKGKKGKPSWNKGGKISEEHKRHISETRMKMGNSLPQWKGDKVGYVALHVWVRRRLIKPKLCPVCKERPPRDLANISQKYKRDINDFEWLCRSCHIKKENRFKDRSEEWRNNISLSKKGQVSPRKGVKLSPETRKKISLSHMRLHSRNK